jgi:hypothetical protein
MNPKPSPATKKASIHVEKEILDSAQESQPVPLLQGKRRLAALWFTPIYNQWTKEVKSGGKGK